MVFSLELPSDHPLHQRMMGFVYWYTSLEGESKEPDINMFKVSNLYQQDRQRRGGIVPLQCIKRLLQLIPVFGDRLNRSWTVKNVMDLEIEYYINPFMDRESYQAVW